MIKTVSLELAKQLKEAGFPQQTEFNWKRSRHDKPYVFNPGGSFETADKEAWFAAPAADEILEQLPKRLIGEHPLWYLVIHCNDNFQSTVYETFGGKIQDKQFIFTEKSIVEAAAKMWMYLKEKGHISNI